jgi:hypothetical protein
VALVARNSGDHVGAIEWQVNDMGCRCESVIADVGSPEEAALCVEEAARRLGSVDILVHAAGGPVPGSILDIDLAVWHDGMAVHLHAAFYLCRAVLPAMRERREGSIILISSAAGVRGCPGNFTYQVIKGALPQFTRALARDFAADNELRSLRPSSFRLGDKPMVFVPAAQTKNGLDAYQPLPKPLAKLFESWLPKSTDNDLFPGEWHLKAAKMLRADLEVAKIPFETAEGVVDFHALRVTYGTNLTRIGMSPANAQKSYATFHGSIDAGTLYQIQQRRSYGRDRQTSVTDFCVTDSATLHVTNL